ncbi:MULTISPECIES: uracil-DNA glycosylase family protein [unclassified Acidovorax]|uniref:uracil-DNA glycosylase family protein n=1 Tax=unclassified Acidovorax TaxID=2684926 RepID=UPI0023DE5950|nr:MULTISPECIES: uracil-DNA glycosylase family protein [unclassified Acidovorax]GKS89230.1 DNA polymerase [Acidovorax sp. SUPP2539]GKT01821.1 DNA polymerase [Acidovorax sp. SUPP3434]
MSLDLDARQRAMLAEMGITVWAPAAAPPAVPEPVVAAAPAAESMDAPTPYAAPAAPRMAPAPQASAPAVARPAPVPAPVAVPPARDEAAGTAAALQAPQPLYPQADPSATPVDLGAGWLVLAESATPDAPLTGDAGKLLDNMLRAMRLHRHPRVFFAAVQRTGAVGPGDAGIAHALHEALASLRPSMVLVLGLGAARAVLESREPLGRLRAGLHALPGGTPAIVTYDPAYLLRAPEAKAAAWADLCRALATVRAAGNPAPEAD